MYFKVEVQPSELKLSIVSRIIWKYRISSKEMFEGDSQSLQQAS